MSVDMGLARFANECGWTEATQLEVLKQFVAEMGMAEALHAYLEVRAEEEFSEAEEDDEGDNAEG